MITQDYHIHTKLSCHAKGEFEQYVEKGIKEGLTEIGFADHLPVESNYQIGYSMIPRELPYYVERVTEIKERFSNVNIRLGIEVDYVPWAEKEIESLLGKYPFDYVIGSVHQIDDWIFDIKEQLSNFGRDELSNIYRKYFTLVKKSVDTGFFDIIGHFELLKIFGHFPPPEVMDAHEDTICHISSRNLAMEINTAGLRRPCKELYPSPSTIALIVKKGIPLVVSSDAHSPVDVAKDFLTVEMLLKEIGVKSIQGYNTRQKFPIKV